MRLKVTHLTDAGADAVVLDVDPDASVGALAGRLSAGAIVQLDAGDDLGLVVNPNGADRRIVAPTVSIAASGLRSGDAVAVTGARLPTAEPATFGRVRARSGPDEGAEFALHAGGNTIGRGAEQSIALTDPMVSPRHATITVDDRVEVCDNGSAGGVAIGGRSVGRAVLSSGDRIRLGDTELEIQLDGSAPGRLGANRVEFNRSPRLDPVVPTIRLVAPEPPAVPQHRRFPIVSLVAPLMMGAVMISIFRNPFFMMFMVFGPVMVVGNWFEQRRANRKELEEASRRFRVALADFDVQLDYADEMERAVRLGRHPAVADVLAAVRERSPLVWTRRREHDTCGDVRLGVGTQASHHDIVVTQRNNTLPELWRELHDVVDAHRSIDDVPVVAALDDVTNLGVAGPTIVVDAYARGLLIQWLGLHAPTDLVVAAIADEQRWGWLAWVPHADRAVSPLDVPSLAADGVDAVALVAEVERLIVERSAGGDRDPASVSVWPRVVIVIDDEAPAARDRLIGIAETGPPVGVHAVWLAPSVGRLPAACRTFVELHPVNGRADVSRVVDGEAVPSVTYEPLPAGEVAAAARRLAPLVDVGAPIADAALPDSVDLVELIGAEVLADAAAISGRWLATRPGGAEGTAGLRAVIGAGIDGPVDLDLRRDGPHALVGGTTGAGKSEFLQTWIMSMATNHDPSRLTFLLVDYKGGAAFADCVGLPHCVGLVTDLSAHMVRRALVSLRAELRRRETLLGERRAKDLIELERRDDPDCPPSLVIVVDEFAALLAEVPEFVEGVIDVAQRGRSLGLHLVLATQRPAGVITDRIRANTNLRIALRMADPADSLDVVDAKLAAEFDPGYPGRAVIKSGPSRLTAVQVAYVGGSGVATLTAPQVAPLRFGAPAPWPSPVGAGSTGPAHIVLLGERIGGAAALAGIEAPRQPWLPPLAAAYELDALADAAGDRRLVLGISDRPDRQTQPPIAYEPDRDGNLLVLGSGGSGKSTVLRSIAIAAAIAVERQPDVTDVYGIDVAGHGLRPLETLPHVGAIIDGDDHERIGRLFDRLTAIIDRRAQRFAAASVSNLSEFREVATDDDRADTRRVLVLLDDVGAFRERYEVGRAGSRWSQFVRIVAEGRAVGVHVVMTADRPNGPSSAVLAHVRERLVLRLDNDNDVAMVDVPRGGFDDEVPPGRGFFGGVETQVATLGAATDLMHEQRLIGDLAGRLAERFAAAGDAPAAPVVRLTDEVALIDLPGTVDGRPTIGVAGATLAPVAIDPTGTFVITGPPHSGVSTTTRTLVQSIDRWRVSHGRFDLALAAPRPSDLERVVDWAATATGPEPVAELATELVAQIPQRSAPVGLVIERPADFIGTPADQPMQRLVRVVTDAGGLVVAEQDLAGLSASWPLVSLLRSPRRGIIMQPDMMDGDHIFKTSLGRVRRGDFPLGRGMLVERGAASVVQVAHS